MFWKKRKIEEEKKSESENKKTLMDYMSTLGMQLEEGIDVDEAFAKMFPRTIKDLNVVKTGANGKMVATDEGIDCCQTFGNEIPPQMWKYLNQPFIGWQACALLKQNPFIDKACTIPVKDAIAPDYKISLHNDEEDIDPEILEQYKYDADYRYKLPNVLLKYVVNKKVFGYSIAIPVIDGADYENPFNIDGVKKGSYKGMVVIDPTWVMPILDREAATNPLSLHYFEPTYYDLGGGKKVHRSWVCRVVNSQVPDIMKPTYFFGGIPLTQMIYERVYAADKIANEAPLMALTKRTLVMDADVESLITNPNYVSRIVNAITKARDNFGILFKRPDTTVQQIDTSLGEFDALIMTQYQLVAAIAEMPAVKLLKTQPKGFNATGEYEADDYRQTLDDIRQNDFLPLMLRHYQLQTKSETGKAIDIDINFNPIDSPTAMEQANIEEVKARTAQAYVSMGVIAPEEEREILRADPESKYTSLPEEMPMPEIPDFGEETNEEGNTGNETASN